MSAFVPPHAVMTKRLEQAVAARRKPFRQTPPLALTSADMIRVERIRKMLAGSNLRATQITERLQSDDPGITLELVEWLLSEMWKYGEVKRCDGLGWRFIAWWQRGYV